MLLNNFFAIVSELREEGKSNTLIRFNAAHAIFEGHFPGQPVVPGVCMMQIVKELLEKEAVHPLFLSKAVNSKFLHLIDPTQFPEVIVGIQSITNGENLDVTATITHEAMTFLKLSAVFSVR